MAKCSFCGHKIEDGQGVMFVRKDSAIFHFCSRKCEKNLLKLKRAPAKFKWSKEHHKTKKKVNGGE